MRISSKPSSEAILISSLLNSQDVEAGRTAVQPEMFRGYQAEFLWLISYLDTYKQDPSTDAFMTRFPDFPLTDHNDIYWAADEVRHNYTKRTLAKAVNDAAYAIHDGDLEEAVMAWNRFSLPTQQGQPLRNALLDTSIFDDYERPIDTIGVPWRTLQEATGGMRSGDLWFVSARLGQGKSWTLADIAAHALMEGKKVLYYSLEMAQRQVQHRMHAIMGAKLGLDIRHHDLHHRTLDILAYKRLMDQIREKVPGELFVVDVSNGAVSPATIGGQANQADLVIVDYVQLLAPVLGRKDIDDWRTQSKTSNMLKEVAVSNDVPIACAAQINREGDTSGWKPPKVKHLAQSDSFGQDADVVITHKRYSKSAMCYSIEKNRHGEDSELFFTNFDPNVGGFAEISKERADDIRDEEDQ